MIILAIDTSFDETAVAICEDSKVLGNVISSQIRYHKKYGGAVPFIAQRLHKERIDAVIELAFQRAKLDWAAVDAIAVTYGPGLAPCLEVGIQKAKELAATHSLPLYPVNHMVGHIASCFAQVGSRPVAPIPYPVIALLVSGGHTELLYSEKFGSYTMLGQTLDDALGEAYDKLSKMVGLGYPGGRLMSQLAKEGDPSKYPLPVPMQYSKDLNFSYSGLKNAVRLIVNDLKGGHHQAPLTREQICDLAASFEEVAHQAVILKVKKALKQHSEVKTLLLAGGVAANTALRSRLRVVCQEQGVILRVPPNLKLCTDNAAMIGVAAFLGIQAGEQPVDPADIDRKPNLSLSQAE